jgi:hypothetical protein
VPFNSCVFAVYAEHEEALADVERRAAQLVRFYRPLGARSVQSRRVDSLRLLIGAIRFDDRSLDLDAPLAWGVAPPTLVGSASILDASPVALRAYDDAGAVIVAGADRARLVVSACTTYPLLYSAGSGGVTAWSSHAVAAGWLATGSARVDALAVPELIASEFVGGQATLVDGVRLLAPATVVDVDRAGVRESSFWPLTERWSLVPERDAVRSAAQALETSLASRYLEAPTAVGLTAGYDSRVVAVALRKLEIPFFALTAETDAADVETASRLAPALGVDHQRRGLRWLGGAEALETIAAHVRWTEGVGRVSIGRSAPDTRPVRTLITGAGGDVGRALSYRWVARNHRRPSRRALRRIVAQSGHLDGMSPEARELVAERRNAWLEPADRVGATGWRHLDITYAENRLRRLYRAQSAPGSGVAVFAYATPAVQSALVSLSVEDKLSAAFYRRYVEENAPDIALPPPPAQRRGVPPVVRRLAASTRGLRSRAPALTSQLRDGLDPQVREWLVEALHAPLLTETCGRSWATLITERLNAGDPHAFDLALKATAPVALQQALSDLC